MMLAKEQCSKILVKLSEPFLGNIVDWLAQKASIRSFFELSRLLAEIDDTWQALIHPAKNAIVCHFLNQSEVKGYASRVFSSLKYLNNRYAAQKQLVEQHKDVKKGSRSKIHKGFTS